MLRIFRTFQFARRSVLVCTTSRFLTSVNHPGSPHFQGPCNIWSCFRDRCNSSFFFSILVNLPHRLLASEEILHGKLSGGDTASQALRCSTSPISFGTPVEEHQFGWTIRVVRNLVNQSSTARRAWGPITASTPNDCRNNRKPAPLLCLLSAAILSTSQFTCTVSLTEAIHRHPHSALASGSRPLG